MALNNLPSLGRDHAWGRPIYNYDEPLPEPSPSLIGDFQALPGIWRNVLLHPRRSTYVLQIAAASWQRIGILLALSGLGSGVLDYLAALESGHATLSIVGSSFIDVIIGSVILTGIWYWFAKRLGGHGQFMPYMYLLTLVSPPLDYVTELLKLIPSFGGLEVAWLITVAVTVYEIYLLILAAAVVHQFSTRRAALALFVPIGCFVLLALGLRLLDLLDCSGERALTQRSRRDPLDQPGAHALAPALRVHDPVAVIGHWAVTIRRERAGCAPHRRARPRSRQW